MCGVIGDMEGGKIGAGRRISLCCVVKERRGRKIRREGEGAGEVHGSGKQSGIIRQKLIRGLVLWVKLNVYYSKS